jgi:hypothetical protein
MALIKCKECQKEVSSSAVSCPHCGAKVPHGSFAKVLLIGFGILVLVSMFMGSLARNTSSPSAPPSTYSASTAPPVAADTTPHWTYVTGQDAMMQKPIKYASVESINELNFGFPYQGAQHATLTLRTHPRFGKSAILRIERGQFLCGIDGCSIAVRFDAGKPQRFSVDEPSDHSTTYLFIDNYDGFLASVRKSKKVYIAAEFYQQGSPVMEFDTSKLNW